MGKNIDAIINVYSKVASKFEDSAWLKRFFIDSVKIMLIQLVSIAAVFVPAFVLIFGAMMFIPFVSILLIILFVPLAVYVSSALSLLIIDYSYNLRKDSFIPLLETFKKYLRDKRTLNYTTALFVAYLPIVILLFAPILVLGNLTGSDDGYTLGFFISFFLLIPLMLVYALVIPLVSISIFFGKSVKASFYESFDLLKKEWKYILVYILSLLVLSVILNIISSILYITVVGVIFMFPIYVMYAVIVYFPLFELFEKRGKSKAI